MSKKPWTLLTTERRLIGSWVLAVYLSQTFLNTWTAIESLQQSGKQDSLRHMLKSSAIMYESSDLQFFRATTGIPSAPDALDK